jgi:hypothetical protein
MLQRLHRSLVVGVSAFVGVAAVAISLWSPTADQVRTADENGDGRPDIWRTYDRHGQLLRVSVDTNFDGRSDIQEYYEHGALVRRELDRDFNDQVDLIQEFDPASHAQVRAEVDVDSDGTADLLVLFRGGQPVSWRYGHAAANPVAIVVAALVETTSHRSVNDRLVPLQDPFRADLSLRATHFLRLDDGESAGLSSSGGLPGSRTDVIRAMASAVMPDVTVCDPASATLVQHSPRGPPSSSRLA